MSVRVVVFGSGRGSNFQAIYKKSNDEHLDVTFTGVVSNNSDSGILEFAKKEQIKTLVLQEKSYSNSKEFESKMLSELQNLAPDYILLAGYMKKIPIRVIRAYPNRIINIHPSLLPLFGGKGMYGQHVHDAVYKAGMKITGATVHFVSQEYDEGPIIMQKAVTLSGRENASEIAKCVLNVEHELFFSAFKCIIQKKYTLKHNRVILQETENEQ